MDTWRLFFGLHSARHHTNAFSCASCTYATTSSSRNWHVESVSMASCSQKTQSKLCQRNRQNQRTRVEVVAFLLHPKTCANYVNLWAGFSCGLDAWLDFVLYPRPNRSLRPIKQDQSHCFRRFTGFGLQLWPQSWPNCFVSGFPWTSRALLPKRGAASTAYFAQFMIEQARRTHRSLSGITLDIKKCFNCIRWYFAYHALKSLGVPTKLLDMWMLSIQALTRHWLLGGQIITSGQGSCGFPEGDQCSVLTMVAVATVWCTSTRACITTGAEAFLSAYADNWSWIHTVVQERQPTVQKYLEGYGSCWHQHWLAQDMVLDHLQ